MNTYQTPQRRVSRLVKSLLEPGKSEPKFSYRTERKIKKLPQLRGAEYALARNANANTNGGVK